MASITVRLFQLHVTSLIQSGKMFGKNGITDIDYILDYRKLHIVYFRKNGSNLQPSRGMKNRIEIQAGHWGCPLSSSLR